MGGRRENAKSRNVTGTALLVLLAVAQPCRAHPVVHLVPQTAAPRVDVVAKDNVRATELVRFTTVWDSRAPLPADPALRAHALGHVEIAKRYARRAGSTVRAFGSSRTAALSNLHRAIDATEADAARELEREEALYDRVTDFGRQQDQGPVYGFPGGENAAVGCP
jgi:predicted secreted Zn-dependent protease